MSLFEQNLDRNAANSAPLTPLDFLRRAAAVYPDKVAVIHGPQRSSYRELYARSCRLASALARRGIGRGDTVAIMAPNTPAMLEAHYGVPMAGAVLNPLNIRLDPATIAFTLEHGGAKVLLTDREGVQLRTIVFDEMGLLRRVDVFARGRLAWTAPRERERSHS